MPETRNTLAALEAYLTDPQSKETMHTLCGCAPPIFLAPRFELNGQSPRVLFDMQSPVGTAEHIIMSPSGFAHLVLSTLAGSTTLLNSSGKDSRGNERWHLKECAERGEGGRGVDVARIVAGALDIVPPDGAEVVGVEGHTGQVDGALGEYKQIVRYRDENSLNLVPSNLYLVPGRGERGPVAVLFLMHRHIGTPKCLLRGTPEEQAATLRRLYAAVSDLLAGDQQP